MAWSFGAGFGYSQNLDSAHQSYVLDEVQIRASRLSGFSTGNKVWTMDSVIIAESTDQTLADILSRHTTVYIKSYGLGGLATTSLRGSGASHTPVIWNGFNLQSPLNGQVDFSLIPAFLMDEVQLQFGGAGALYGTGAVGGVVHLNSKGKVTPGVSVGANLGAGSFGRRFQGLHFSYGKENKWSSSIRTLTQSTDNDFLYDNPAQPGSPTVRQSNAALEQFAILNSSQVRIGARDLLNVGIWYQNTDRQLPPTMTQASSEAFQEDQIFRISAQWKRSMQAASLAFRSALLKEENMFQDPAISLVSLNESLAWMNELELDGALAGNYSWNTGVHWSNFMGKSDNLGGRVFQNRIAGFGSFKVKTDDESLGGVLSLRQEVFNGRAVPVVPTFGVELIPSRNWLIKGTLTRNYRLPTFNDFHWNESFAHGNPELEPESGWSQDITLNYDRRFEGVDFNGSLAVYNSRIRNRILWSPDTLGIWSPNNLLNVRSRGMEVACNFRFNIRSFKVEFRPRYNYVSSTNQEVRSGNEASLGKQLIYVPQNNSQLFVALAHSHFKLRYDHSFTGKTYTTTDNSDFILPYNVGNLFLKAEFGLWALDWNITGEIRNIWNHSYQVIAYRPMPLRNYYISLALVFNR